MSQDLCEYAFLKDETSTAAPHTLPLALSSSVAANDTAIPCATYPNPAETYLLSLAEGSRRAMSHALNVVACVVKPGAMAIELDWAKVGCSDVARVRSALASKYSPAMANKCLAAVRGVLKAAFRVGLINVDTLARTLDLRPVRGTRTGKGRCLGDGEMAELIAACDRSTPLGIRNAAIVAVGFGCGLRRAELVGLEIGDILEGGQSLRVRGKGNKERIAYLPQGAHAHLAAWLCQRGDQGGALFCPVGGHSKPRRLSDQTVYDVLRALTSKARLTKVSPHDLRRTFVSTLLNQGVSLSTVSAMAGHADVSTTARYDRRGEQPKKDATMSLLVPV